MSFSASETFRFPPDDWSLRWYENLFTSPEWTAAILNSLQVGVYTAVMPAASSSEPIEAAWPMHTVPTRGRM